MHIKSFLLGGVCASTALLLLGAAPDTKPPPREGTQQYRTIWDYDPVQFNRKVQLLLDDGWRVQAGVSVSLDASGTLFGQALVK